MPPKPTLKIGDISAEPGAKSKGFLTVPNTPVQMPLVIVNGAQEGPTLLVTAGIHGGEYPCIEAGIRFGREIEAAQVCGQVIVIAPVSLNAFQARQAFLVPEDGKNLNRMFPGKATGTIAEQMAHAIMTQVVPQVNAWVDLHGGDIPEALVPFSGYLDARDPSVTEQSRKLAAAFGIEYVVRPTHLSGTTLEAATTLGIPALLAEAGQLGVLDEENTQILLRGCRNVARHLGILPGKVTAVALKEFKNWPWVRASHSGCWYPAVAVGDMVTENQVVGVVKDYFGEVLAEYRAPSGGLVLLLCAALSVKQNDPLIGIAS
jgi:uncharacterized protein